ncbi:hypothetical protein ONZ45_g8547 [Pleurotus djamor]|nr:hypothetical protein ONZ45_g8547 [Pleurotus djamor]
MARVYTDTAAQEAVDEQIAARIIAQRAEICAMKSRRNAHCAVAHLPDEVLALVFEHFQVFVGNTWHLLNQVCTHWRAVATNTPQLWSKVNLNRADFARIQLQRTRSVPIDLTCRLPQVEDEVNELCSLVREAITPSTRIRSLNLRSDIPLGRFLHLEPIHAQAPTLQSLMVAYTGQEPAGPLDTLDEMLRLRCLSISFIPMPVDLPILPFMTRLDVSCCKHDCYPVTTSQLVRALERMPLIEFVHVHHVVHEDSDTSSPPLSLPSLREFKIRSSASTASRLFDRIDFPASTCLQITCEDKGKDGMRRLASLCYVLKRFPHPNTPTFDQLRLTTICDEIKISLISTTEHIERKISFHSLEHTMDYASLFHFLRMETVVTLTCNMVVAYRFLRILFSLFTSLKHLRVLKYPTDYVHRLLQGLLKTGKGIIPPTPALETISGDFYTDNQVKALEAIFKERSKLGIPIKALSTIKPPTVSLSHLCEEFGVCLDLV